MNTQISPKVQKNVWVVDDDETVLMLAEEVLKGEGFQVETFREPARALEAVALRHPDIIVLDVMMPGMDGFEFCSRLRQHPAGMDVPVLMVTALDDPHSITRAYEVGATNFAIKPLNWEIETHRLRYMLRVAETARLLKSKEQETRLAKEDWERTFNSISDMVTVLSPDLKVVRANLALVTALKKPWDQIIGCHCYQLFQDAEGPCPNCPIMQTIRTQSPVSAEQRYHHPAADCLVSGSLVTDQTGQILHVIHIARDLTKQKQLELEYRHAQKMEAIGTLAGGIAHDFNNLLMVVSGCAQLMRDDTQATGEQKELADTVSEAAQRGAALSGQLLTFSRKSMAKSEKRPLQFNSVVRDMQKMLQRVLPKNIAIHTHLAADLHWINGSADQLNQVLMNLAVNASHAMPSGGSITIDTRNVQLDADYGHLHPEIQPGEFILLAVMDTGMGMDRQTLQHIYEPFFTTKKVGEGTGLGLSVVYGIIQNHGGHILCSSEAGVGTTFKIHLPALPANAETAFTPPKANPVPQGGKETILIVEDEVPLRTVVQHALTKLGYTIISAGDGESALLRCNEERNNIRLVIMDLGMPGMGGWNCLKQLHATHPKLPVLLTTGYGGQDIPAHAQQEGAAGLIAKPYQLETLFQTVRETLDRPSRPDRDPDLNC
jgi:signal transduction histidine kinase/DNA-binding response OmpR family regulator